MKLFLNELSLCGQSDCEENSIRVLKNLNMIINSVTAKLGSPEIFSHSNLWQSCIQPDLNLDCFVNRLSKGRNRDLALVFRDLINKKPYLDKYFDKPDQPFFCRLKVNNDDITGSSVAYAAVSDGHTLSFQGSGFYDIESIEVLIENESGDSEKSISNLYNQVQTDRVIDDYLKNLEFITFSELWNNRGPLFPNLDFCDAVEKQLEKLDKNGNPDWVNSVRRHLKLLNDYFHYGRTFMEDSKEIGPDMSPEREQTMNKYGHLRKFRCPDGEERLFPWHCKLRGNKNLRIHFFPTCSEVPKCTIGYIGKHLPGDRNPT